MKEYITEKFGHVTNTDNLYDEMFRILKRFDHYPADAGITEILYRFFYNKASIIDAIRSMDSYVGDLRAVTEIEIPYAFDSNATYRLMNNLHTNIDVYNTICTKFDEKGKTRDYYLNHITRAKTVSMNNVNKFLEKYEAERREVDKVFCSNGITCESYNRYDNFCHIVDTLRASREPVGETTATWISNKLGTTKVVKENMKKPRAFMAIYKYFGLVDEEKYSKINRPYKAWKEKMHTKGLDCSFETWLTTKNAKHIANSVGYKGKDAIHNMAEFYHRQAAFQSGFAELSDSFKTEPRKLNFVVSCNPLDYLTSSFGNSWASCHTIDKENIRGMENSYHGMYCSGNISYMLDDCTIITYIVKKNMDVTKTPQDDIGKLYRNLFHVNLDDKLVLQGRVYPQGNDGNTDLYKIIRNKFQSMLAPVFGVEDYWKKVGRDTYEVVSWGSHYRDYDAYTSYCNWSFPKENQDELERQEGNTMLTIGHAPICINCGEERNIDDGDSDEETGSLECWECR